MKTKGRNLPASVQQRLRNRVLRTREDLQNVLTRYAAERFLYRLSRSDYADELVVKGAMLFLVWTGEAYRATKDLDLMGRRKHSAIELAALFRRVCQVKVEDDGMQFSADTVQVEEIREDNEYGGLRVKLAARLGNVRIPVQVDVGFGDVVTPRTQTVDFPVLLDLPAPRVVVYSRETAIAEKFETMVRRGLLNSRMKDYYDLWIMAREFEFDGDILQAAIRATFKRRKTPWPAESPFGLTAEFAADGMKQTQWRAFTSKSKLRLQEADFGKVVGAVREFLLPVITAPGSFIAHWPKGGPWRRK
jgi:predicted nucleotidyltransferase component of viral defense system